MHEINVLTSWTTRAFFRAGEYPDLNRKLTVPHTVVLPIELYSPCIIIYVGVIRTLNSKYQKFMTYRLVYNIFFFFSFWVYKIIFFYQFSYKMNETNINPVVVNFFTKNFYMISINISNRITTTRYSKSIRQL